MKKIILFMIMVLVISVSYVNSSEAYRYESYFEEYINGAVDHPAQPHNEFGVELNMPNLMGVPNPLSLLMLKVEPMKGWYQGPRFGKMLGKDLFYDDIDYFEDDRGYYGIWTFTNYNCFALCPEK